MRHTVIHLTCILLILASGCQRMNNEEKNEGKFTDTPKLTSITPGLIDEASGIADSHSTNDALWVHEDSENPAELTLISHTGIFLKKIPLINAINRDWEDMAMVKEISTGRYFIYIADIGDNDQNYDHYEIYRFPEPAAGDLEIKDFDKISFNYEDGPHDAEAILIDEMTNDIFIITKRDFKAGIYKIPYPQETTLLNIAGYEGSLDYTGVTSAAISPDGLEVILKTYSNIYLYNRSLNESIPVALQRKPLSITYTPEPQGEAICYKKDNQGFFTLSERAQEHYINLRYYKRN